MDTPFVGKPMAKVAFSACHSYAKPEVEAALERTLSLLGGIGQWVKPGDKVLIKPNLLSGASPDKAVTTHPQLIRAVCILAQKAGGRVSLGESPGIGTFTQCAKGCGLDQIAREIGVELLEFSETVSVPTPSGYRVSIGKPVMEADVIINLPKVKTHTQMYLTLGMKNCFGYVPGGEKARWHFRAGIDEDTFARMLVDIYLCRKPDLTIADAVLAMEGNGPGLGTPRTLGWLAASDDTVALDRVCVEALGLEARRFKMLSQAQKANAGETDLKSIHILGAGLEDIRVSDFRPPDRLESLQFNRVPPLLRRPLRDFLTSRPFVKRSKCIHCGRCFKACPANAIRWKKGKVPSFEYAECIRCFCCHEMCESDAIYVKDGFGLKLLQPIRKRLLKRYGI